MQMFCPPDFSVWLNAFNLLELASLEVNAGALGVRWDGQEGIR